MAAYYNEYEPYCVEWLTNLIKAGLIPDGEVDSRSITEVHPDDLREFTQCHFFAGIGGWGYAARLADWPDDRPLWTGSCPCQPFSRAAHGANAGTSDPRHLWPVWFKLIQAVRPPTVFGEQVASATAWTDEVLDDMESQGYTSWAGIVPACSVGADHIRERLWFSSHSDSNGQPGRAVHAETSGMSRRSGESAGVLPPYGVSPRVGQLRAFGNAIVPQVAAQLLSAFRNTPPSYEHGR